MPVSLPTSAQDRLLVLDPEKVTVYTRRSGIWEPASTRDLDLPPVRDPRGRLLLDAESLRVLAPGLSCRGAWQPALDLNCENQPAEFEAGPGASHFTPARNSLETEGWPVFYSYARLGTAARPLRLVSGLDGRVHLYNQDQRPLAVIDEWNSDFAPACGGQVLAAKTGLRAGLDVVTAYRITDGRAVETSEPVEFDKAVAKAAGLSLGHKKLERFRYLTLSRVVFAPDKQRAWLAVDLNGESGAVFRMDKVGNGWNKAARCAGWVRTE